jgi:phage baseplate assembly protein W
MPKPSLVAAVVLASSACAAAFGQGLPPAGSPPVVVTTQPVYTPAMRKLMDAAQHLRQSIHAMASKPAGPERDAAIAQANRALRATQRAMGDLPPDLRATGTVDTTGYDASVKRLMAAADTLRDSIHSMATEPAGPRRNQAIRDADRALLDTQVAMATAYDATAFNDQGSHTITMGGPPTDCVRLGSMLGCRP